jgi:hypothetical protein
MAVPVEEAIAALSTFSLEVPKQLNSYLNLFLHEYLINFCYIFFISFAMKFEMRLWIGVFSLLRLVLFSQLFPKFVLILIIEMFSNLIMI